jgi:hypothetical protein
MNIDRPSILSPGQELPRSAIDGSFLPRVLGIGDLAETPIHLLNAAATTLRLDDSLPLALDNKRNDLPTGLSLSGKISTTALEPTKDFTGGGSWPRSGRSRRLRGTFSGATPDEHRNFKDLASLSPPPPLGPADNVVRPAPLPPLTYAPAFPISTTTPS